MSPPSPPVAFGSKAETLERLAPLLRAASVLPLSYFSLGQWRRNREEVMASLGRMGWTGETLIVRSSSRQEDSTKASLAGHFLSLADIRGKTRLAEAIDQVSASMADEDDQVLVQPMLRNCVASGVAFTRDPSTRAPYVVINYESGGDTFSVTGGKSADIHSHVHWKGAPCPQDPIIAAILDLTKELETLLGSDCLDLEFGIDAKGAIHLFQVRPLVLDLDGAPTIEDHRPILNQIASRIANGIGPDPFIHGLRTVYGIMPDWNPAEIIGVRPRPLALSLYRELVTDSIWAYQRHNYGYTNLRSHPLMIHFHGLPYIDVRVSFNSFVPADIPPDLAERLVNYYIDCLLAAPHLHDKVEFAIIMSCYTPSLSDDFQRLRTAGFSDGDCAILGESLRRLTNAIIHPIRGIWRTDAAKLETLERRRQKLQASKTPPASRIYWLLEDCKRFGSLPFAGLARAGFIAVQMLQSLVRMSILSPTDYHAFMSGLNTVGSRLGRDRASMDREQFLARYGHLRPGTYDIMSPRYDETPDAYFDWSQTSCPHDSAVFELSSEQRRTIQSMLETHRLETDCDQFMDFLRSAIEGREYAKFAFTHNLSDAISLFRRWGEELGFAADDLSYADANVFRELHLSCADATEMLHHSIEQGRRRHAVTQQVILPPIITTADDVWSFALPACEPNFITLKSVTAEIHTYEARSQLAGSIVAIPNADPGFDWLFSYPIAGLITAYGGANSHMAIRAGELGIPAVIGCGDQLFSKWSRAKILSVDCSNRLVTVLC